jgi:hypothetical protein
MNDRSGQKALIRLIEADHWLRANSLLRFAPMGLPAFPTWRLVPVISV